MQERMMRLVKWYLAVSTVLLIVLAVAVFGSQNSSLTVDEITVQRIHVLDEAGRERVTVAGGFAPRRAELAGILFHNAEGTEAGGLVYHGQRGADGATEAGGILTFDQFGDDQIMTLEYAHAGGEKRNGLTILDRPEAMSERVLAFYRAYGAAGSDEERERIKKEMLPKIPPQELAARRLFVGRNVSGASLVSLCDAAGRPRLNLEVDENGVASIEFLDPSGQTIQRISPSP